MNEVNVIAKRQNGEQFTATTYGDVAAGEFHVVWSHDCNGLSFSGRFMIAEVL